MNEAETIEKYQRQLMQQTHYVYSDTPISAATERSFFATPRHLFVKRYRQWGTKDWNEVRPDNLQEHLATLYANGPLILFGDDDNDIPSTISAPSFVLRLLDMLQLKPGHSVFELGTGSGWNAALMGHLVGPDGHISSVEIIAEVAAAAADAIKTLGLDNVSVVTADGGEGYAPGAPYDRAIFTAGTYDLPRHFYEQLKEEALLLVVIKIEGGGDTLFVLRKTGNHFESLDSMTCGFVQLRGKYKVDNLEPVAVESLPEWPDLQKQEVSRTPFWWGGEGRLSFAWRTLGVRSFLAITEPGFRAFKTEKTASRPQEDHYFGLLDRERRSLVMAKDDQLIAFGNEVAKQQLLQRVRQWVELGMPTAASFRLKVYLREHAVSAGENEWIVKRNESQFVWRLGGKLPHE